MNDRLDRIAAHGTGYLSRLIRLADDTTISIKAGPTAWSRPRPYLYGIGEAPADYAGPYTHLEVYLITPVPVPGSWAPYDDDANDDDGRRGIHFGAVPVELVRALVEEHGGEHWEQDLAHDAETALAESFAPELFTPKYLDPLKGAFGRMLGE